MNVRKLLALLFAALICASSSAASAKDNDSSSDPAKVRIVTSDISRFWHAFDDAQRSKDPAKVFAYEYFAPGTLGLWGFVPDRLISPFWLAHIVTKYHAYYEATRPYMEQIPKEKSRIVADLYRYKSVYPKAVFPNVYFVVGTLDSAGTSVDGVGMVMGSEMISWPPRLNVQMPGFQTAVLATTDRIPGDVIHEFTHYNQKDADTSTLLDTSLVEGSADFMADMIEPTHPSQAQWSFGCSHEDALWQVFKQQMASKDQAVSATWLFSYDPGPLGAPPFIGYWLGARIVQTYYETHGRSQQAVDDILHINDYPKFLRESGYPEQRPACKPPALKIT
jgi:hypothetical protein